jgi:V8-like Glu-specific endopeptidase
MKYPPCQLLSVFILGVLISGCRTEVNVFEKYHKSVVLLYHEYYYKVTVNDRSWYLGYDKASNTYQWNSDITQLNVKPYSAFGTGFFIDRQGRIATNKHVVDDWFNSYEPTYRKLFQSWMEENKNKAASNRDNANRQIILWTNIYNTTYDYYMADSARREINAWKMNLETYSADETMWTTLLSFLPQAKFDVHSLLLGYALDGSTISSTNDFQRCHLIRSSANDNIDLAIIQANNTNTPVPANSIVNINDINERQEIKVGEEVSMIGFNLGPQLAISKNGLQVQKTDGKISQQSDGDKVLYSISALHGSSGSPVFDKEGNLVAINYAGLDFTQNFNYGVLAKHLKLLLRSN